eukprot:5820222-Alexandrium_andersonii.AAC.1
MFAVWYPWVLGQKTVLRLRACCKHLTSLCGIVGQGVDSRHGVGNEAYSEPASHVVQSLHVRPIDRQL